MDVWEKKSLVAVIRISTPHVETQNLRGISRDPPGLMSWWEIVGTGFADGGLVGPQRTQRHLSFACRFT